MTRSEIRQVCITLGACLLTAAAVLGYMHHTQQKIAVVDAIRVFNDFKMKQELEAGDAPRLQALGRRADSLKTELAARSKLKDADKVALDMLYRDVLQAQQALEQTYQESNQAINEQVWKRLNPLIDAYGREEGLRLIIGANGMGNVLYNDNYYDRTQAVTDFVNKRYEAGN